MNGTWRKLSDGSEVGYASLPGCCVRFAAGSVLRSADEAPGFVCLACKTMWERVGEKDESLAQKIRILRGDE